MIVESGKVYDFKKEFWQLTGITKSNWETRKEDLLEWLKNFYDYEIYDGKPIRIYIKEVYGNYMPLPRKLCSTKLSEQKKEDYKVYTIGALGHDFKPNSKSRIARAAISEFGKVKYGHNNPRYVAQTYVKDTFNEYGETNNKNVWVWYSTYVPIDDKTLEEWRNILSECHISESEAANAFYKQEQGEDITKEKNYYKEAQEKFKELHEGEFVVKVSYWKCKS